MKVPLLIVFLFASLLAGCAVPNGACRNDYDFVVTPVTGTANHAAQSPGNQVRFQPGSHPAADYDCKVVDNLVHATYAQWTTSDAKDVTVSSEPDDTNGLATCIHAAAQPVTLTAVATPAEYTTNGTPPAGAKDQTVTVTLTCN